MTRLRCRLVGSGPNYYWRTNPQGLLAGRTTGAGAALRRQVVPSRRFQTASYRLASHHVRESVVGALVIQRAAVDLDTPHATAADRTEPPGIAIVPGPSAAFPLDPEPVNHLK
jgi:hypothetical protein